jgi:hypothetical protein
MVEKLADVWFSRDLPVLVEVARQVEAGSGRITPKAVAAETGLSLDEVNRAGIVLSERGLVTAQTTRSIVHWFSNITSDAYPLTGLHPEPGLALDRLVAALEAAERQASGPERGKFRAVLDGIGGLTRDVAVEVIGAAITGRIPL